MTEISASREKVKKSKAANGKRTDRAIITPSVPLSSPIPYYFKFAPTLN